MPDDTDAGVATLLERFDGHVRERPSKCALVLRRGARFEAWSYADLARRTSRWAATFAGAAAEADGHGRVVLVVADHTVDTYAAFLGAMRAGLTPGLLPPPRVRQPLEVYVEAHRQVIARTRPLRVVTPEAHAGPVRAAAQDVAPVLAGALVDGGEAAPCLARSPDETALLQHSSGTTGLKKGVALSFRQVDDHVAMLAGATGFGRADVVASWLPLYHDMGLFTGLVAPLTLGASIVALDPFAWVAEPATWLRAVAEHRATLAWLPNFAFAHLVRTRPEGERFDLSSLRLLNDCSEPCRPETVEAFLRAFADDGIGPGQIGCCYGLAEAVFAVSQTVPGRAPHMLELDAAALEEGRVAAPTAGRARRRTLLSCGVALPGVEIAIDAPPGFAGEIRVRSATAVDRYFGADGPDPAVDADGWRRTGDVGLIEAGELFVCGRIKETIIVRGRNLYGGDIEAAVSAVSGVRPGRVAAVPLEDVAAGSETLGLLVETIQELRDPASRQALERAIRAVVRERFDVGVAEIGIGPPGWLAKSTAGKVSRAENLERLRALRAPDAPYSDVREDEEPGVVRLPLATLVETVARALADCFGHDAARVVASDGPDDVPGWDSLGHTVLLLRLERATGLRLDESAAGARTVGDLAARLAAASALQRRAA